MHDRLCARLSWHALTAVALLLALVLSPTALAVKRHDFKTCEQSGFCKRNRLLADRASNSAQWSSPYALTSPEFRAGKLTGDVSNAVFPGINYRLEVTFQTDGVARVKMDEVDGLRQRYNETAKWAIDSGAPASITDDRSFRVTNEKSKTKVAYNSGRFELELEHEPVKLTFKRDGVPHIVLNERGLLNMEHFRLKPVGEGDEGVQEKVAHERFPEFLAEEEVGEWEETFAGKKDSKPKGPESLSLDIGFPGYEHVYGIPQHASSLSLKETRGGEGAYSDPYRLYNLDVFEYDADSEMAIYGSIPFMKAHRAGSTVGVFLLSASEAWIDITKKQTAKQLLAANKAKTRSSSNSTDVGPGSTTTWTHWMFESGILDAFIFLGPSSNEILSQYTALTGRVPMPQLFAIAYHQCRWNYISQDDVEEVSAQFDAHDIPMDVMWLDIEYADEHQYMVWDRRYFPEPEQMQDKLAARGRKLVAIVDPHIKRNEDLYYYKEAKELDILQKGPDGKTEFKGHCWTGDSAWTDWFNPRSFPWWIEQFKFDKFVGSTKNLFVWNDMNEPSIFDGPEITMIKDAVHHGGWEHRDVHNVNALLYHKATADALIAREDVRKRPFVLTRGFFAGSQKYGAMWTGDNLGTWAHLASTVPMLLTNGIAGMTFAGSDVGGFFGNPSSEMLVRWYQIGAFSPFFRAHGHIDTKRREPYLFDQPVRGYIRDAIRLRYTLLPSLYTAFFEASVTGLPILRPQYLVFPDDPAGFAIDDQFYFGGTGLLVKPVAAEGSESASVYIADDQPYYDYLTNDLYFGSSTGGAHVTVPAPLGSVPVLQRGGHILPRRDLVRRSSTLTWKDPVTLVVGVDLSGTKAEGSLYLDDGESFSHENGEFVARKFALAPAGSKGSLVLSSRSLVEPTSSYNPTSNAWAQKIADVTVREVVINGLPSAPSCVKLGKTALKGLDFTWNDGLASTAGRRRGGAGKRASQLVIKDAGAAVIADWDIHLEFAPGASCSATAAIDYERQFDSPACPIGHYFCPNKGHVSSCILRSRFNDGICEPECCDGSDETDGKVSCPNRCAEVGAASRKAAEEAARKHRVGAALRAEYVAQGAKERTVLEGQVTKAERELGEVQAKERAAREKLEALEQAEAGEIERKKSSLLYEKIVEMQAVIAALRQQRSSLEGHVSELSALLTDLSKDFNPNYQDMAVLGATRAFKDWQVANGVAREDDDKEETDSVPVLRDQGGNEIRDFADADLRALEDEDPIGLMDSVNLRVAPHSTVGNVVNLFKLDDYIPDAWRPKYDHYKSTLLSVLAKTGVIHPPADPASHSDRPELARARNAHSAAEAVVESTSKKLENARSALEKDWGPDWEWKKLDQQCVEYDQGEYIYSVCFFGKAEQRSKSGGARTSLGSFTGWAEGKERGEVGYWEKQRYENGQRCWNGPARSAKVDLVCATQNELLSVVEPEKCEYLFKVSTPAVCYPDRVPGEERDEVKREEL